MTGVREIGACRLCGAAGLGDVVDFGKVALGNNLQETEAEALAAEQYPLVLRRCADCGHFQLGHAVPPEILYATNYTYLSGTASSFVAHLKDYAEWADGKCALPKPSLVVDVGSNDGTALKAFQLRGHTVCGVDPAQSPARIANENGVDTINDFFDAKAVATIVAKYGQADYVTSHNVLAHVDDLAGTFRNIHALLKPGGYFGFEIGYFREVLQNNFFDTIYHEHLDYHHAAPLVRHLNGLGFRIEDLSTNKVQGGSLRLLARKTGEPGISAQARGFLAMEKESVVNDAVFLRGWRDGIVARMGNLQKLVRERRAKGLRISAYGAPTKATLLSKVAGLGKDDIDFIVEDNALKIGRYLPTIAVPIAPTARLFEDPPDVLLIFAWNFAADIRAKLAGRFKTPIEVIVPLPEPTASPL